MTINTWDLWAKNFDNAKAFFETKGNLNTKGRLKEKWHKDFMAIFTMIEKELRGGK